MVFHLVCGVPPAAPALPAVLFLYDGRQHPLGPTLVRHAVATHANKSNFTICRSHGVAKVGAQFQQVLQALVLVTNLQSRAMIEANISCGSNTGKRKVVCGPLGVVQRDVGPIHGRHRHRLQELPHQVSTGILRDGPALTCTGNVSNPLGTCGFTLFEQLLDLMGAERVLQVESGDV